MNNHLYNTDYMLLDEFQGAEPVLIRAANEVTPSFLRDWCALSRIHLLHVFGSHAELKRLRQRVAAMSQTKKEPVTITSHWLGQDVLQLQKPFGNYAG